MRKPYSPAYIAETVALAVIVGADETARRRNIDVRTVRGWCAKAGRAPADAITTPEWRELGDLARSGVAADLASGKLTAVQKATIAAIAQRNVRDVPVDVEPEHTPEQLDYALRLEAALAAKYGIDTAEERKYGMATAAERANDLLDQRIADLLRWSITEEAADRPGMVADETPEALVARLPDDWEVWRADRDARAKAEAEAATARGQRAREAWPHFYAGRISAEERDAWLAGGPSPITAKEGDETAEILAAAEEYLRRTA